MKEIYDPTGTTVILFSFNISITKYTHLLCGMGQLCFESRHLRVRVQNIINSHVFCLETSGLVRAKKRNIKSTKSMEMDDRI